VENAINTTKNFFMFIKEIYVNVLIFIASLYVAAKESPMAFLAGGLLVLGLVIFYVLILKVLYGRRKRGGTRRQKEKR